MASMAQGAARTKPYWYVRAKRRILARNASERIAMDHCRRVLRRAVKSAPAFESRTEVTMSAKAAKKGMPRAASGQKESKRSPA